MRRAGLCYHVSVTAFRPLTRQRFSKIAAGNTWTGSSPLMPSIMSRLSGVFLAALDALKDDPSLGPGIDLDLAGHLTCSDAGSAF
jgi:hypothetical protein